MKRFAWVLALVCMGWVVAGSASEVFKRASDSAASRFPARYPLWIARIMAQFGDADAQAFVGFQTLESDPCKGANLLQSAANQHHFFAEMQLQGYYFVTGKRENNPERIKTAFLWYLHFMSHFPGDKDESHHAVAMFKLTPEQENEARETFKTWKPENDPPVDQASCAGKPFDFY